MGGLGAPMTVVGRPVDQKRSEAKEARRGRGRASDEYWCVIDVDQHTNLGPAVEKAITNGISVAVSNPCVELWFILHYQHQAAEIDRKRAQAISKELLKCDKVLDERALQALADEFPEAKARAKALDAMHFGDGRPARSNPSSGVWKLVDRITGQAPGDMLPAGRRKSGSQGADQNILLKYYSYGDADVEFASSNSGATSRPPRHRSRRPQKARHDDMA